MALILISALSIRVLMDICFKLSVQDVTFVSLNGFFPSLMKVVFRWTFLIAILISFLNFWLWMMVLSHYDLSFAYPMFGVCFALIMLSGTIFFGEKMDQNKLIGIGFILLSSLVLIFE